MKIRFNNFKEFVEQKTINKVIYENMCYNEKRELKWYVYNVMQEKNDKKDLIWEYLNESIDSEYYMQISLLMSSYIRRNK